MARFQQQLATLTQQAQTAELALCFFDESGLSPIPPLQSGWSLRAQTRCCCPDSHKQRVNVLGCLQKGGRLMWETVTHPVAREDVIAFFERLANSLTKKTVVVLDNAGIHHGAPMRERQTEWAHKGLHLLYLPPYCPELNAIEILWKQAKYFGRRFLTLSGTALRDEEKRCNKRSSPLPPLLFLLIFGLGIDCSTTSANSTASAITGCIALPRNGQTLIAAFAAKPLVILWLSFKPSPSAHGYLSPQ